MMISATCNETVVEELRGHEGLEAISPEWATLCIEAAIPPLYGPLWMRAHIRAYERGQDLTLLAVRSSGRLTAVLPLIKSRGWSRGLPTRVLRAAANANTLRFDISLQPGNEGDEALAALWNHLAAQHDWDCLQLPQSPLGGAADAWIGLAARSGYLTGRWPCKEVPFVPISPPSGGAPPPGMEQTSAEFRSSLRRKRRRLGELGRIQFASEANVSLADLEEFYTLEAAGWKGHADHGQALLHKGPRSLRFYQELAATRATEGACVLHRLRLNGQSIAMSLGLCDNHGYYLLKTTYDEQFGHYSPGHLLTEAVIAESAAAGRSRYDFSGEAYAYESRWTRDRLPHHFLYAFPRSRRGRLLYALKFGAVAHWVRRMRSGRNAAAARSRPHASGLRGGLAD